MKRITALFSMLILAACEGPVGPPGPPGSQGPIGPVGQGFEVEIDFTQSNNYTQIVEFPGNAEVLKSDVVLVYLLFEVDEGTGNDVWQPLPASFFFESGELQYGFDHTLADVRLFLTGNVDFSTLGAAYTEKQVFRVAILPVDSMQSNNIDPANMDEVMGAVRKNKFQRIEL